jgi:light-regulated signal transduction histidine kinase (bacteriophytochrome)
LKGENNTVDFVLVFVIDVTELKKAQHDIAELNRSLEEKVAERTVQLEAVNKELEAFSYSVSHDLRAPLRAINGYAKIMQEDYGTTLLDAESNRLLAVIQQNAKQMGVLIDDLLAFSRLGRKEIQKVLINMNDLVNAVIPEINKTIANTATIKIGELHPVKGDYTLIYQVIVNLLSNAVKYSSKKADPVIQLSSKQENGKVVYAIEDNGVGFDMQYVHKLFGVFQRLHTSEEFDGTGVGLAIVKRIISKHDGSVWAEGKPGEGATFYFNLPQYQS